MTCLLDGFRHHSLVLRAVAGVPAGANFSLIVDETLQQILLLVVDRHGLISAELAYTWASTKMATAASTRSPLVC